MTVEDIEKLIGTPATAAKVFVLIALKFSVIASPGRINVVFVAGESRMTFIGVYCGSTVIVPVVGIVRLGVVVYVSDPAL